MVIGLVIIFGGVVGLACFAIKGSGYGLWWDISLGASGSVFGSVIMTTTYLVSYSNKADIIGLNWYSMTIGAIGALMAIYIGWSYNKISSRWVHAIIKIN